MQTYQQGDIVYVDLNPAKGVEMKKLRPCVIVSSRSYNIYMNTVIVVPISNSPKYQDKKYESSPLFLPLPPNGSVEGTVLIQHLRSIDPREQISGNVIFHLPEYVIGQIVDVIGNFF